MRRWTVASALPLLLALSALATLSGCTPSGTGAAGPAHGGPVVHWGAAASAPDEPRRALDASVGGLGRSTYQLAITNGGAMTGSGAADWASHTARLRLTFTVGPTRNVTEAVTADGAFWVRLDYGKTTNRTLGITANAWTTIQPSKLRSLTALPIDISGTNDDNPFDMHGWTRAVVAVQRVDPTHFTGTVDLLKAGGVLGPTATGKQALTPATSTVPFTAAQDAQGRLTRFTVDASTVNPELSYDITFSGYGVPVTVSRPAKPTEASPKLYAYYNAGS